MKTPKIKEPIISDRKEPVRRTMGELYGPAMTAQTKEEADAQMTRIREHVAQYGITGVEADNLIRSNLGYYAGYYDNETRERVELLFECEHPIFGSIAKNGPPSMTEALEKGIALGKMSLQAQLSKLSCERSTPPG